jgi:ankyrin repeat protein
LEHAYTTKKIKLFRVLLFETSISSYKKASFLFSNREHLLFAKEIGITSVELEQIVEKHISESIREESSYFDEEDDNSSGGDKEPHDPIAKFVELFQIYLQMGGNPNRDASGSSHLVALLIHEEAGWAIIREMIKLGARPDTYDEEYGSALHIATTPKFEMNLRELLKAENVNVNILDANGSPPLLGACMYSLESAKLLLEAGADINIRNQYGENPYFFSVLQDVSTMDYLLRYHPDLNLKSTRYGTILKFMVMINVHRLSVVNITEKFQFLISKGEDPNPMLTNGVTESLKDYIRRTEFFDKKPLLEFYEKNY